MHYAHLHLKCVPQRLVVAGQCGILLTVCYMMRFCLSFAITRMTRVYGAKNDPHSCPIPESEKKLQDPEGMEFKWTSQEQGYIHSGLFWGYFATQIPGGILADMCNHKVVLLSGYFLTVILTALTPIVTRTLVLPGLVVIRVLVGMAQGIFYNALHAVAAHWIPPEDRAILGTLAFSGSQIGTALNGIFSGLLLSYFSWPWVFYAYSGVGFIFGLLFFFTTYTYPSQCPHMKENERQIFEDYEKVVNEKKGKQKSIPFLKILANYHVWAMVAALFGQDWTLYTMVTQTPTYLDSVLYFNIQHNGWLFGGLFIFVWINALLMALLCDYIEKVKCVPLTWNRRMTYLIGSTLPALGYIAIIYSECNKLLATVFLVVGMSTFGFFYPSVKVNPMDLSPNFAGFVGSVGQMGGCLAGSILPSVVGTLTPNKYKSEWKVYFWISSAVTMGGALIFFCFASAKVQPFNDHKKADEK